MVTSKVIINNLKKEDVSSLLEDLKTLLSTTDSTCQALDVCSILKTAYHLMKGHEDPNKKDKIISSLVPSIHFCVNYIKENTISDESLKQQFLQILYHIISVYLKLELYADSLSSAANLKSLLSNGKCPVDEKENYTKFLSALFWNEALKLEKKNESINFETSFNLRCQAVEFTLFDNNLSAVKNYSYLTLVRYCYNNNQSVSNKITHFLQNVWLHICAEKKSYDHMLYLFKLLYSWFEVSVNYCSDTSILTFVLSRISEISLNVESIKLTNDEINVFKCYLDISKYAAQIFSLKENVSVSTSDVVNYKNLFDDNTSDLAVYASAFFYLSFLKAWSSSEREKVSLIKPNLDFCTTLVLRYLHIFPGLKLQKGLPFNTNSDITLTHALVKVICLLIKNEANEEKKKMLITESKEFIRVSLEKLLTRHRNAEFEINFSNFAKSIGNIGFASYNSGFYSESIYFLETGLKSALFDEKDIEQSFKWRQILVYCYFLSGNHRMALQNVATLLLKYKDKTTECIELWHKVKRDALKNKDMTLTSSTISDILEEMNKRKDINREEEISLLLNELKGCKLERCPSEEEILNIVKKLMSLQCCGIDWAYVMLVTITMGLSSSKKIFSLLNMSSLDMCIETINLFKEYVMENPTNNEVKIQLSISYVWLYFLKLQQLRKQAEKEGAAYFEPKSEEEGSESDIMPTIPLLTFLVEAETIKSLEMALELWTDISNDSKNSWSELAEPAKNWDLLTVIQAAAEFFSISANDVYELRTLVLLQTVASVVGNKEQELSSSIALINFLVRIGYLEMASQLVISSDTSIFNDNESKVMRLKFQLAESSFLLQKGRFDEGLKLLRSVLKDPIFEKSYRSIKMLQIQSLMLQSKFLLVPPSAFTDSENIDYLNEHNAISSAMDCASAAKRLLKLLTEKQTVEGYNDWFVLRTQLLKNILNAYLLLAEHYIQIGDPRFARCFLLEGLRIAEENILTYWSSKMLILLGKVDLICKDINDCMVKLNCLKYVMDENSLENASMLLNKNFNNTELSESVDVSEDFIISNEIRLNFTRTIKQNFINNSDVQSSPISNKRETNSKFEVKSNAFTDHNMFSVYIIQLEIWALSCLHLIAEGNTLLAETQLRKLLKKCELMKSTNKKVCSVLKSFNMDLKKGALLRVPSIAERMLSVSILHNLSLLYFSKGDFKLTKTYLDSAFKSLCDSSEYNKYLYSNIFGLLKYHQTVVSVKNLIGIKPDYCLEFAVCPSVDVKSLATKKVLKDSPILNVTPQKANIPKIHISPCAKKRVCKAPLKKGVLPAHIKKDMKELNKSHAFASLIFSSSDDEFFSKSPMPSAPKKSSKKTNSTTVYKGGHESEKSSYKLFKSKNSDLNINASCDIWKFPDLATPKLNKISKSRSNQVATKSLRITRQNTRMVKSDANCTSKLFDSSCVKDSTILHSNKGTVLCSDKYSLVESSKSELYGSEEGRTSIEHYRGTSKRMQKRVSEDIAMDEDVFYPDCAGDVLHTKKQPGTFDFPLEDKRPSFMETLCDDLNALDVTENTIGMMEHKIPDEKLIDFMNELDEIRLLVQHNAPYPLYVNLCKLLAVLVMHKNVNSSNTLDSAFLLSETFASILRQIYLGNYPLFKEKADTNNENSPRELSKLLKRKDTCIIKQMEYMLNVIPENFTVVQITPLFEKDIETTTISKYNISKLIICRYQRNSEPLVMCLNSSSSEMSTTSIFSDFANILSESTLIMKNNDDRRSWWTTRSTLDMRLKSLVKCIEDTWVGCWKGLLLSSATNEKRVKHLMKIRDSICKLSEPSNKTLLEVLLDSASFLSRGQLSAAVCHLWNCKPSDEIFSKVYKSVHEATNELPETTRNPLILILDKDIQALPWESLPILTNVPVSRMPSLNIMISKLSMPDNKSALQEGLDCSNAYYILNPGGDLKYSQEYFQPRFEKQTNWEGIVGNPPSAEECALALKNRDLFVYCGHGSGKQYLEGKTIDKMRCHASAILMGCSSGRLKQFGKQLEAYGIPLTYLMNGCPCVVGNLWDVTDKDIDRFTDKLFELLVPNYKEDQDTTDVATAVSDARSACKMRYLVGSAPIIYGFPVFAKK